MADIFEITGRIHSTSQEHVISPADEILDTSQNKKQHLINSDVARHESEINSPTNGLNKRVEDIEALGQLGDTPVETNASNIISNTSLNGKVPSASAVNGVYNAVVANAGYYTCNSEASTDAKVVEASGYVLTVGGCIKIKMTNANTVDDATLNINSTGAKALYYEGERASAVNSWEAGETVEVYYDGTNFYANNIAGGSGSGDGAFDVSAKYPTSGVEGGNTYTLEGALAVINANLSASKKKGGMSVKFVQSIDNKYVQYRLMDTEWSTAVTDWQGVDDEPTPDSPNIPKSGGVVSWGNKTYGYYVENGDFLYLLLDSNKRMLLGVLKNGDIVFGAGVPNQVKDYITEKINELGVDSITDFLDGLQSGEETLPELLNSKVDGKYNEDSNYLYALIDNNKKVLLLIREDGSLECNRIVSPTITGILTNISQILIDIENIQERLDNLSIVETVTVENSDKIGVVGDSYTQSSCTVKGKSYVDKMSLFSDYQFLNFGASGQTYPGMVYRMRIGSSRFGGIPFKNGKVKYAMLCCYTNDIKYVSFEDYIKSLQYAINAFRSAGTEPIVCTEYHTGNGAAAIDKRNSMRNKAEENDCLFYDIASFVDLIKSNNNYTDFWATSHPGTRTNAIESDNYSKYLDRLERPSKSLKVFRPRSSSYSSLDDFMFNTNYERAEKFKEIYVGSASLSDSGDVDACSSAETETTNSEYGKLSRKEAVGFNKCALVSCILPSISKDISHLALRLIVDEDVTVYRKSMSNNPPSPSTSEEVIKFYVSFTSAPTTGSVYKCEGNNKNYTVVETETSEGQSYLFCSPAIDETVPSTGTLTLISGTGDATINYTYAESGYISGILPNDTCGHWVEIAESDGIYDLSDKIYDSVDYDKVHFLVISSGTFNISDIAIDYVASAEKPIIRKVPLLFDSNYYSDKTELLPSNTFGTPSVLDANWNITPVTTYEQQHGINTNPKGFTSVVVVNEESQLSCTLNISTRKDAILEIWCRYFPDVYTNGSGNQITEDSFDYAKVIVIINDINPMCNFVNTHWKMLRFNITIPVNSNYKISVSSDKNVEVVYVSLK